MLIVNGRPRRIERADHFELGPAGLACAMRPCLRALAVGDVPVRAEPSQVEVRFCRGGVLVVPAGVGALRVALPQRRDAGDRLGAPEPSEGAVGQLRGSGAGRG